MRQAWGLLSSLWLTAVSKPDSSPLLQRCHHEINVIGEQWRPRGPASITFKVPHHKRLDLKMHMCATRIAWPSLTVIPRQMSGLAMSPSLCLRSLQFGDGYICNLIHKSPIACGHGVFIFFGGKVVQYSWVGIYGPHFCSRKYFFKSHARLACGVEVWVVIQEFEICGEGQFLTYFSFDLSLHKSCLNFWLM